MKISTKPIRIHKKNKKFSSVFCVLFNYLKETLLWIHLAKCVTRVYTPGRFGRAHPEPVGVCSYIKKGQKEIIVFRYWRYSKFSITPRHDANLIEWEWSIFRCNWKHQRSTWIACAAILAALHKSSAHNSIIKLITFQIQFSTQIIFNHWKLHLHQHCRLFSVFL